jgi:hypothetical protein
MGKRALALTTAEEHSRSERQCSALEHHRTSLEPDTTTHTTKRNTTKHREEAKDDAMSEQRLMISGSAKGGGTEEREQRREERGKGGWGRAHRMRAAQRKADGTSPHIHARGYITSAGGRVSLRGNHSSGGTETPRSY